VLVPSQCSNGFLGGLKVPALNGALEAAVCPPDVKNGCRWGGGSGETNGRPGLCPQPVPSNFLSHARIRLMARSLRLSATSDMWGISGTVQIADR
jgi:hypothetical protein